MARATDRVGNVGDSAPVGVTVANPDTVAPTVSLTAPQADATLRGSARFVARAQDTGGSGVARVSFQARAAGAAQWTVLGQDPTAPYAVQVELGGLAAGRYSVRAVAVDRAGNTAASAAVAVTIAAPAQTEAATKAAPAPARPAAAPAKQPAKPTANAGTPARTPRATAKRAADEPRR